MALIVFDVDDTLYLERDYVASGLKAVDHEIESTLGVRGFYQQAWPLFADGLRGTVIDQALGCSQDRAGT